MRVLRLRWTSYNEDHIARHGVVLDEVEDVVFGRAPYVSQLVKGRYLVVGQTAGGRYLSVILDREPEGEYFVVTARDATLRERRLSQRHRSGR